MENVEVEFWSAEDMEIFWEMCQIADSNHGCEFELLKWKHRGRWDAALHTNQGDQYLSAGWHRPTLEGTPNFSRIIEIDLDAKKPARD